ncbi:MAG TPA: N-acetyltransferase [Bacteroidetes bacterium]|nr:N-acetyltransferase [Bacteroidota bacterium]HRR07083.1 GNAT family N-acetyltransferase [Rhodothermales bacterium]
MERFATRSRDHYKGTNINIEVKIGLHDLTPARIATLYRRAPLQRPVEDHTALWRMFEQSSLVVTAWVQGRLVGLARVLSDGVLNTYICDFAVEPDVQGLGIGRMLLEKVRENFKGTQIYLYDAKTTSRFYAKMGFLNMKEGLWKWQ